MRVNLTRQRWPLLASLSVRPRRCPTTQGQHALRRSCRPDIVLRPLLLHVRRTPLALLRLSWRLPTRGNENAGAQCVQGRLRRSVRCQQRGLSARVRMEAAGRNVSPPERRGCAARAARETNVSTSNKQRQRKWIHWTSAHPKQVCSLGRRGGIHGIGQRAHAGGGGIGQNREK